MNALQRYLRWARGTTAPIDGSQPGLYAYEPTTSERVGNAIQDRVGGQTGRKLADVARFVGSLVDPQQIARDVTNMTSNAMIATRRAKQQPSAGNVANALIQDLMLGAAIIPSFRKPSSFLAAHSTPHEIKERFDWRKYKSTGEGAQAYGDGTYVTTGIGGLGAPHSESARAYAGRFATPKIAVRLGNDSGLIDSRQLYNSTAVGENDFDTYKKLLKIASSQNVTDSKTLRQVLSKRIKLNVDSVRKKMDSIEQAERLSPTSIRRDEYLLNDWKNNAARDLKELQELLEARRALNEQGLEVNRTVGNQYLVRVHAPYGDLPALDQPIMSKEQPSKLHEFIRRVSEKAKDTPLADDPEVPLGSIYNAVDAAGHGKPTLLDILDHYKSGKEYMFKPRGSVENELDMSFLSPREFSETLQAAGFPGARYLEAGSRDILGARSIDLPSNAVMYDDSLIEILAKRPLGPSGTYTVPPLRKAQ